MRLCKWWWRRIVESEHELLSFVAAITTLAVTAMSLGALLALGLTNDGIALVLLVALVAFVAYACWKVARE